MKKIILIVLLFSSCTGSENKIDAILTNKNAHWVYYTYPEEQLHHKTIAPFYTVFSKAGTTQTFFIKTNEEWYFEKEDATERNWFSYKNDSLNIRGNRFKVVKYTSDTIVLKNKNNHIQMLVRIK